MYLIELQRAGTQALSEGTQLFLQNLNTSKLLWESGLLKEYCTNTPVNSYHLQTSTTRCPLLPTLLLHVQLTYCYHTLILQLYSLHWNPCIEKHITTRLFFFFLWWQMLEKVWSQYVLKMYLYGRIGGFLISFPSSVSPSYPCCHHHTTGKWIARGSQLWIHTSEGLAKLQPS